jgi:deoxyadenosine/deoxycytidine kinase
MPIITIDGNIGSGKTSILKYLQSNYGQIIDLEPVEQWKPYLDDIYLNDKNHFNFQKKVWEDRALIQSKNNNIIFVERSAKFTRETFVEVYKNKFSTEEFNVLNYLYQSSDSKYNKMISEPILYIYISVPTNICIDRIIERNRNNETNIDSKLINKLHIKHEECYKILLNQGYQILKIDGTKTIEEICNEILKYINNN